MLERKFGQPFQIKAVADDVWEVSGYASTFGGEPDAYGDIVARGAFLDSIAARKTRLRLQHETPIGLELSLEEDDHGLLGRWKISQTPSGAEARQLAIDKVIDSLSIGYLTEAADFRDDGVRVIRKATVYEVSMVDIPANENAVITNIKSLGRPFEQHSEAVKAAIAEWLARVKSGSDTRATDGRELSESRKALMAALSGSLRTAADEVDALLVPAAPVERIVIGAELRRRRYTAAGISLERPA